MKGKRLATGLALSLASVLAACGDREGESASSAAPVTESAPEAPGAGHESSARTPAPPMARFGPIEGSVTLAGAEARTGLEVSADEAIEVPEGGRAAIDLREGGRFTLEPGSSARVVAGGVPTLVILRGGVHAQLAPAGNSPRSPIRVSSPTMTAEIPQSGQLYLAVFSGGSSWLSVLQGMAVVFNGESDSRRRLRTLELPAGQAVAATARLAEPTAGPGRLSAAQATASALAADGAEADTERMARELEAELTRMDGAMRWLETETRRGRELTRTHRQAVREQDTAEATRLQRALVEHSRELYRLRRLSTARWERVRAQLWLLTLLGAAPHEDPLAERRSRIEGLLGD